jgi:DNA invertase Pin-like site-specific DNA recombinase
MKVAIYSRVSDDKKKDDGSRRQDIQRQIDFLVPIVLGRHPELKKEDLLIYKDDGKSAFTEDWNQRPDFKRLFNDCRRHFIQEFWIEDMTRFSRRIDVGLPLLRELGQLNIQLISSKEGEIEVTSSDGWLRSAFLLFFAEWDSRSRADKIRSGMKKAQNLGKKVGGFRGGRKPIKINKENKDWDGLT